MYLLQLLSYLTIARVPNFLSENLSLYVQDSYFYKAPLDHMFYRSILCLAIF